MAKKLTEMVPLYKSVLLFPDILFTSDKLVDSLLKDNMYLSRTAMANRTEGIGAKFPAVKKLFHGYLVKKVNRT